MDKKLWFRAKKYGWGWTPVTWQGWLATGLYTLAIAIIVAVIGDGFESRGGVTTFFFLLFLITLPFIYICIEKGEKPRWRWGK